jgi:hypothetical protein
MAGRDAPIAQRRFQDVRKLETTSVFDVEDAARSLPRSTRARQPIASTAVDYLSTLSRRSGRDWNLKRDRTVSRSCGGIWPTWDGGMPSTKRSPRTRAFGQALGIGGVGGVTDGGSGGHDRGASEVDAQLDLRFPLQFRLPADSRGKSTIGEIFRIYCSGCKKSPLFAHYVSGMLLNICILPLVFPMEADTRHSMAGSVPAIRYS